MLLFVRSFLFCFIDLPVYSYTISTPFYFVPFYRFVPCFTTTSSTCTPMMWSFILLQLFLFKIYRTTSMWSTFISLAKGALELEDSACNEACVCVRRRWLIFPSGIGKLLMLGIVFGSGNIGRIRCGLSSQRSPSM